MACAHIVAPQCAVAAPAGGKAIRPIRPANAFKTIFAALVPTFQSSCYISTHTFHELRKVMGTSESMILVVRF